MSRFMTLAIVVGLGLAPASQIAAQSAPATAQTSAAVEPEALQALQKMSAYLGTLSAFEVKVDATADLVMQDGERVQIDEVVKYKVRRPDGLMMERVSSRRERQVYYDGKQLTVYAPKLGYYASVPAPPTIRETLDAAAARYGISLPMEDLFRWSEPNSTRSSTLQSGYRVGEAMIDGVLTDHYAFREPDLDWQIWIEKGARPIPRKVVIVDRIDEARPAYSARLTWNVSPQLASADFHFTPDATAKPIRLAGAE